MTDPALGSHARLSDFSADQELLAEIPAGIGDLLHDRARERYYRRVWQTIGIVALAALVIAITPSPALSPTEHLVGALAGLGILGYLAWGFTWAWPERWEHQLLLEEIDHRRRNGKWRWER